MHRLLSSRQRPGSRRAANTSRHRRLRAAGAVIAAAGLASAGLAAAPAGAVAAAAVSPAAAAVSAPGAAGVGSAAARMARHRPAPPVPLSAQRPLARLRAPQLPSSMRRVCPVPSRVGQMECMSLVRTNTRHYLGVVPHVTPSGYGPTDLQSAYNLAAAASGGVGATVAVVDPFNDPNAAADLAVYRSQYNLPACNTSTGAGCVTKVNQQGQPSPLPAANSTWAPEIALDLEMVTAICPNCHILLVEANSNGLGDLGTADNTAVITFGVKFVSDSWNGVEFPSQSYYDNVYFNHPGVAIAVAAGDAGYGPGWPSASQYVTSVGGTTLTKDSSARGWSETVWKSTGSGCSSADPKPSWQKMDNSAPGGCLNRTQNDVSAVGDPLTGVATYSTYPAPGGWSVAGGTSVATPIIASVYALAGTPTSNTYPASYLYQSGSAAGLYDVTSGSNGSCEPARPYLCTGKTGYDGPSGLGPPNGTTAFASTATGNVVTLTDPGVQDEEAGTPVFLDMAQHAVDSASGQTLTYSATGLPANLTIDKNTGNITGVLGSTTGTNTVTVTATDSTGAHNSVTFTMVVMKSLATGYHPVAGPVHIDLGNSCVDDAGNSSSNGAKVQIWACNGGASQNWTFQPNGNPGGNGTLTIHGKCLDILNRGTADKTPVQLFTCNSGSNQQWLIDGSAGELYNPNSGKCLTDPSTTNGTQLWIYTCSGSAPDQAWILPASPVQSGVAGKCMDDAGNGSVNGTKVQIWTCTGGASQKWTLEPDSTLRINKLCLDVANRSKLDGAPVQLYACNGGTNQRWSIGSNGQLINQNSGRCLDDLGDSTVNGKQLVQEDCYGQAGEIWAVT